MNKSDIVHFYHKGGPIRYYILFPEDGHLEEYTMGSDIDKGQVLQLTVVRNTWKSSILL